MSLGDVCKRVGVGLALIACAIALCGCDAFYSIAVENYSSQTLILEVFGYWELPVTPCHVATFLPAGPRFGTECEARITDQDGKVLQSYSFRIDRLSKGEAAKLSWVVIRYPLEGALGCDEPEMAGYRLRVHNSTAETLDVAIEGCLLVDMLPSEERQIVVVQGSPYDPPAPEVVDSDGNSRFQRRDLYYSSIVLEHPVDEMATVSMGIYSRRRR